MPILVAILNDLFENLTRAEKVRELLPKDVQSIMV